MKTNFSKKIYLNPIPFVELKIFKNIIPASLKSNPENASFQDIANLIANVTQALLTIASIFAFFMILYSGFQYVSAFGNENKATSAKTTLTWSIVGIIVIVVSKIILAFFVDTLGYKS